MKTPIQKTFLQINPSLKLKLQKNESKPTKTIVENFLEKIESKFQDFKKIKNKSLSVYPCPQKNKGLKDFPTDHSMAHHHRSVGSFQYCCCC